MTQQVLRVSATLLLGYGLWVLVLATMASRFLYPFFQTPFTDPRFQTAEVGTADGLTLPLVYLPGTPNAPTVLILVGNAASRAHFAPLYEPFVSAGLGVALVPYRGAEGLPGTPSETLLKADALRAFDRARDVFGQRDVHVLGYSMGGGLAMHVAARREVSSVSLLAPLASACRIASRRFWVPACLVPGVDHWQAVPDVPQVHAPVLIQHGDRDRVVPDAQGRMLADALNGAGKTVTYQGRPGLDHGQIGADPETLDAVLRWIAASGDRREN